MKSTICKLLLVLNLLPFTALGQANVETQIKRVERGLLRIAFDQDGAWSIKNDEQHLQPTVAG